MSISSVKDIDSTTCIETDFFYYKGYKNHKPYKMLRCRVWRFCKNTLKWRVGSLQLYTCVGYYTPGKGAERCENVNGEIVYPDRVAIEINYREIKPTNGYVPYYTYDSITWGEGDDFDFCHISQITPVSQVNQFIYFRDGDYDKDSVFVWGYGWVKKKDAPDIAAKLESGELSYPPSCV